MITPYRVFVSFIIILAAALTFFKIPLASSQGVTLVAAQVAEELPTADLDSPLWQQATAIEVPLSAQVVARPMLPETKVKVLAVRALHNDQQLALLVEWADETQNDSMVRVQDFRDTVAVQFPLAEGPPFYCMGQLGGDVNIWHWKADWQADLDTRQDLETAYPNMYADYYAFAEPDKGVAAGPGDYTDVNYVPALAADNLFASTSHGSPVEDLIAGGFGSLTSQGAGGQNVQGYGAWADGKWRVIFSRDLTSTEAEDVSFAANQVYSIAFAAWDGANGERNGQKSTSQWVSLQLGGAAAPATQSPAASAAPAAAATTGSALPVTQIMTLSLISMVVGSLVLLLVLILLSKLPERK